jgi:hypothetical protein
MDYALNWQFCVRWMSLKSLAGARLQKAVPLFEAYKSYSNAFNEYLDITQIS